MEAPFRKRLFNDITADLNCTPSKAKALREEVLLEAADGKPSAPQPAMQFTAPSKASPVSDEPEEPSTPPAIEAVKDNATPSASPTSTSCSRDGRPCQHMHLLLSACHREEAAESRAESAEAALAAAEARAAAAEQALQSAHERIQLLELQVTQHAMAGSKLQTTSEDGSASQVSGMSLLEDWAPRDSVEDPDWEPCEGDVGSETLQLRLELEDVQARLMMSRQVEQKARSFADASTARLDAFSTMLRGAADIAFAGKDTSACRLRHHLFRSLDVDCDGFLGAGDLQHWYRVSESFLETAGHDAVTFQDIQAQLADALYHPTLPDEFLRRGKISLLQLSRSKMGAGILSTLLNLDNAMQERSTAEWGARRIVSLS